MITLRSSALVAMALAASSCSTHLTHEKATQTASDAGPDAPFFEYFLPKQVYTVEVTYRLRACPADIRDPADKLQIRQEATVTEESVIDLSEHYYIKYRDLDSALKTSSFQASVYPNQTLKSLGASVEDQTAQTIKNLVSSGLTLAKLAIGLPAAAGVSRNAVPLCTEDTLKALKTVKDLNRSLREDTLTKDEREAAAGKLEALRQYLSVKASATLEPQRDKPDSLTAALQIPRSQLATWFVPGYSDILVGMDAEEIELNFKTQARLTVAEVAHGDSTILTEKPGRGVVYRSPMPAEIAVCTGQCAMEGSRVIGGSSTTIAQLGAYRAVVLDNYVFSKNNVTLSFATNGMLDTMAYGTEASLPKATGLLAESSAMGLGFANALAAQKEKERTAEATAELNSIQSETALLNARSDLIEARKRLLTLEGETDDDAIE